MRKFTIVAGFMMVALSLSCIALAGEGGYTKDEYIFQRLLQQRAQVYERYVQALKKGKEELKLTGEIELATKNDVLEARAKKDRLDMRLITIALRHGWEVPELNERNVKGRYDIESRELEKVFGIANILVKSELRKDAGKFISNVELPAQKMSIK